jgi:hypothetical protein
LKARLVADGKIQVRSTAPDISSPTVATESMFCKEYVTIAMYNLVVEVDNEWNLQPTARATTLASINL